MLNFGSLVVTGKRERNRRNLENATTDLRGPMAFKVTGQGKEKVIEGGPGEGKFDLKTMEKKRQRMRFPFRLGMEEITKEDGTCADRKKIRQKELSGGTVRLVRAVPSGRIDRESGLAN